MAIERTAISVAMNGTEAEEKIKTEMNDDSTYKWLSEKESTNYKYYLRRLDELKLASKRANDEENKDSYEMQKEKKKVKKSRWDSGPAVKAKTIPQDIGLVQYALHVYGRTDLEPDQWKQLEDQRKMKVLHQMMAAKQAEAAKLANAGKFKYEYDSDEEIDEDEGTWEHKRRREEMEKTMRNANELNERGAGKHHIGDYIPTDVLEKFFKKWENMKDGQTSKLLESDYQEFKVNSDNIGFKMLQKMGWSEGQGLGAKPEESITQPINKATQGVEGGGVGLTRPDNLSETDDEYDAYRKRMMLAYRFRPNPLNNPRRNYY